MPDRKVLFGAGLGAWDGAKASRVTEVLQLADQADSEGPDLFSVADHPYFGGRLDAYATLARAVTSLSALSAGRVVLGIGRRSVG